MRILIHTYGRAGRQITWNNLSPGVRARTELVVQEREAHLYDGYRLIVLPNHIRKLAETRQHLMETISDDKVVILDDDLQFAVRRIDDPTKFHQPTDSDINALFREIDVGLDLVPLIGVGAREGGNRNTQLELRATRQMRVHGIHLPTYRKLGVRFDRVEVMEDFDVTLQFLEAGYSNLVLNSWVTNQGGSNTSGGCSHYRTDECQKIAAFALAELHPGLVKVVKKSTKTSWGGKERYDVTVQWKRAFAAGRARLLDRGKGESEESEGSGGTEAVEP